VVGIHGRAEGSYQRTGQENVALKSGFNLAVPIRTYTAWVNKTPLSTTNVAKTGEQFLISGNQKFTVFSEILGYGRVVHTPMEGIRVVPCNQQKDCIKRFGSKTPPFTAAFLDFECRLLEL
jgi:hypothetical protein